MSKELIYSVEDDENIRELIAYALKEAGFEVQSFASKVTFFDAISEQIPSLVVLDLMLEDGDGSEILESLRKNYAHFDIKVIVVSAKNSEINIVNILNGGADDYMTKPFSVLELIARIKANLRKKSSNQLHFSTFENASPLKVSGITLIPYKRCVQKDDKEISLTQKEFELFYFLASNVNVAIKREAMLDKVWGIGQAIETRTVDMHIKCIREKLHLSKNSIVSVRGIGYKFTGIIED
ncbi:MAG: response regulator transcription factor [Treponemataceae bacterium]